MKTTAMLKKAMITGLTLTMVLGGATAAFAHGKEKGHNNDKNSNNHTVNISAKGNAKIIFNFIDTNGKGLEWAAKNIASLASKRVFEGYEDGTFRPQNKVTQIEAITGAVRLMGLRDKAESAAEMQTQLNFSDADKVAKQYAWAVGYVAVAAENDLFSESTTAVQPDKPASRVWATTLLVKALKLDTQAKAEMNTHLNFADADKIPAGSVGYVAVAIEKGLVSGFEDNTFRPNEPITRAQIAALLDRTGDQMNTNDTLKGTVTSAVYNNTLSILKDNVTTQINLDPNAFIFRGNVKVTASDIKVGDVLKAHLYNNIAIFVEVTTPTAVPVPPVTSQSFTVDGLFNSLTLNDQGQIATISITQTVSTGGTQVAVYNVTSPVTITGDRSQLLVNHPVELKGDVNLVNSITIQ